MTGPTEVSNSACWGRQIIPATVSGRFQLSWRELDNTSDADGVVCVDIGKGIRDPSVAAPKAGDAPAFPGAHRGY
jgi:hypothetical protein